MVGFWAYVLGKFKRLSQDPVCTYCQHLLPPSQSGLFCDTCLQQLSVRDAFPLTRTSQVRTYAAMLFNAQNRSVLYGHKFRRQSRNTEVLTQLLIAYWEQVLANAPLDLVQDMECVAKGHSQAITVVPIPPHEGASSHLDEIARAFAERFGYAYAPDLLTWTRSVQPQRTLTGKKRRFSNVSGSLSVVYQENPKQLLTTRRVILLDDIHTTGATLHEASQAFLRCPVYDGQVTNLALSYLSLAFQKHHPYQLEQVAEENAMAAAALESALALNAIDLPMVANEEKIEAIPLA